MKIQCESIELVCSFWFKILIFCVNEENAKKLKERFRQKTNRINEWGNKMKEKKWFV